MLVIHDFRIRPRCWKKMLVRIIFSHACLDMMRMRMQAAAWVLRICMLRVDRYMHRVVGRDGKPALGNSVERARDRNPTRILLY